MSKTPFDYQIAAHNSLWNSIHDPANYGKNPLVVMATGLGKSLNMAMFFWHMLSAYPHLRIMQITHVKELVEGNYKELLGMWPAAPAGIYAAGLGRKDTRSQLTFAMINSVYKRAATFGKIDFIVIDEAHRLSDNDAAMYGVFIKELKKKNPDLIVVGFTATPFRMGSGHLLDGELFDHICYDIGSGESFVWAVQQGYLIMPLPTDPGFQLDDSAISLSAGDFKQSEASAALREQNIIERAIDYSIMIAEEENRRSAIAFAQSIDDAELIADMLTHKGYPTMPVHSKRNDRDEVIEAHKRNEIWGIVNKDILTTGWNNPLVDLFIGLRLTRSPGLWVQMIGRMTRPIWLPGFDIHTFEGRWASIHASGKVNARVLDFTGNTQRLGPINYPNLPKRRGTGGGEQPVRKCEYKEETGEGCRPTTYHHVSVKVCPHCGHEFPKVSNINAVASTAELVTDTNPLGLPPPEAKKYEVFDVHEMRAVFNEGKPLERDQDGNVTKRKHNTVKVTYRSGHRNFHTWVCFEHPEKTFPRNKANDWWHDHGGHYPAPDTCEEALEHIGEMEIPKFIRVWINTKYPEIVGYDFKGTRFELGDLSKLGEPIQIHEPMPDPLAIMEERGMPQWMEDDEIPF